MSQLLPFLTDEQLPPSRNKRSPFRWIVVGLVLVALVAGSVWVVGAVRGLAPVEEKPTSVGVPVLVVVNTGDSLSTLAENLAKLGVVTSASTFLATAELDDRATRIGPGVYSLTTGMDAASVINRMLDPASRAAPLVIPEGLRLQETLQLTAQATGLSLDSLDAASKDAAAIGLPTWANGQAEGFLFPASYDLIPGSSATDVLAAMVHRFSIAADEVSLVKRAKQIGRTPYEVLTVASLAQAEVAPSDMRKVARVAYNRLDKGLRLEFDSTVNYALGIKSLTLNQSQVDTDSPYNTYLHDGLPPTPIDSPGQLAIEAAISPAKGDWLYFYTIDPQNMITKFTADYEQFLKWKQKYSAKVAAAASPSPSASASP